MKYILLVVLVILTNVSCKKEGFTYRTVTVTIMEQSTFDSGLYAARVITPNTKEFSFLCRDFSTLSPMPTYGCDSAIYIRNLPAEFAVAGKNVSFKYWKDHGQPKIFSSVNHAHELEVGDLKSID